MWNVTRDLKGQTIEHWMGQLIRTLVVNTYQTNLFSDFPRLLAWKSIETIEKSE